MACSTPKAALKDLLGLLLVMTLFIGASPHVAAQSLSPNERGRYLSFAIRDQPMTLDEARALANGETTLDTLVNSWLDSPATDRRVFRFFNDMFGASSDNGVQVVPLAQTADGAYHKYVDAPCTAAEAVDVQVWWTDEAVKMCPEAASTQGYFTEPDGTFVPCQFFANFYSECGCGPGSALCLPENMLGDYLVTSLHEPAERGLWVYREGGSWEQWLAGDSLYANRFLYHFYLALRFRLPMTDQPGDPLGEFFDDLMAVPLDAWTALPYPGDGSIGEGPEYAGFVTGPAFMAQHNNFRSRIAALTASLLCDDVGPQLNLESDTYPSGIDEFLSADHDALTLSHATPDCAGCHYPMDNLGSALFGFGSIGEFDDFRDEPVDTSAYVFGELGTGPKFLMAGFIQRAPQFHRCMAKRAWESIAGESSKVLSEEQMQTLMTASAAGPRSLLQTIMSGELLLQQR